jgi:hypothetical protein
MGKMLSALDGVIAERLLREWYAEQQKIRDAIRAKQLEAECRAICNDEAYVPPCTD